MTKLMYDEHGKLIIPLFEELAEANAKREEPMIYPEDLRDAPMPTADLLGFLNKGKEAGYASATIIYFDEGTQDDDYDYMKENFTDNGGFLMKLGRNAPEPDRNRTLEGIDLRDRTVSIDAMISLVGSARTIVFEYNDDDGGCYAKKNPNK